MTRKEPRTHKWSDIRRPTPADEPMAAEAVETLNGWAIPVEESGRWYISRSRAEASRPPVSEDALRAEAVRRVLADEVGIDRANVLMDELLDIAVLQDPRETLERAANEGRNVLPDATDDEAAIVEQAAVAILAATPPERSGLDVERLRGEEDALSRMALLFRDGPVPGATEQERAGLQYASAYLGTEIARVREKIARLSSGGEDSHDS